MRNRACRTWRRASLILLGTFGALWCIPKNYNLLAQAPPAAGGAQERGGETAALARDLVGRAGLQRGLCAVLGRDRDVAVEIARASELLVYVREPNAGAVAELRKEADAAGFGIERLVVEEGGLGKLPFADNTLDIIIATAAGPDLLGALPAGEALRALRPQGTAIVGAARSQNPPAGFSRQLEEWAKAGGAERIEAREDASGAWIELRKPALQGVDEWTHWEHGPDNNPVSTDQVIKAPYMTQFLTKPFYIGMPCVTTAAGGRTFNAVGHIAHHRREWDTLYTLVARSGYNGTVLWERKLPEGYLVHRSAFIATGETFYRIDGDRVLLLDPQTGQEKGSIRVPGLEGEWKWMALLDGVLYALAGEKGPDAERTLGDGSFGGWSWSDLSKGYYTKPRIPFGFGDRLAAWSLKEGRVLWVHKEAALIDSRCMAVGGGKIYLYCPEKHLRALDTATGEARWTQSDPETLNLIEESGKKLTSTPGFRTACMAVLTPDALVVQGQTQMNVIAVSTRNGYLLWTKKKITNNPNAIFTGGGLVLGVGAGGSHIVVDPASGEVTDDLKFGKVACTRLTATPDSFFVRGEGTLRFDRATKRVLVDGAIRPACNDGALGANGMLYLGPWQCDCNLSLIGHMGKCSAGSFRFDAVATEAERLEKAAGDIDAVAPLPVAGEDWPTYRGNNHRSGGTKAHVAQSVSRRWEYAPSRPCVPTAPVAAGGLVFVSGEDGKTRALDGTSGALRWEFATPGPIKYPPSIWEGRAYIGCGDGSAYALEAASGRLLWRFRAAPAERHIMVYGNLTSTWPVNSGVLVHDGVAYFAAGIIDHDGTHVYAVDARTGAIKWQNNASGHLNADLRKGVSVQGNLTITGDLLLLAGGNQVSPAPFNLKSGECLAQTFEQGQPKANAGRFVGVFRGQTVLTGGRILHSAVENVPTKGSFAAITAKSTLQVVFGGVPPAWDEKTVALVNFKFGKVTSCDADKVAARIDKGYADDAQGEGRRRWFKTLADAFEKDGAVRWQSDLGEAEKFEAVSLAVCPNAVIAVVEYKQQFRAQPQWLAVAFDVQDGKQYFRHELDSAPLPGGLLVDAKGQVIVTLLDGHVVCLGTGG